MMMPGGRGFDFVYPVPQASCGPGTFLQVHRRGSSPRLRCHPLPVAAFCTTAIPHEQQCRWDALENVNAECEES